MKLVSFDKDTQGVTGAIVWWALHGAVAFDDLRDALEAQGFDKVTWGPSPVSAEVALSRAVQSFTNKRMLARPLRRGMWELVSEAIVSDETGAPKTMHARELRAELRPDHTAFVVPEDHAWAKALVERAQTGRFVLEPADISAWFTERLTDVAGVQLRERGGVYFVPKTHITQWRELVKALQSCNVKHRVFEVPAMQTDSAVEALITALRTEATEELAMMEAYMAGETSTRGLNAYHRRAAEVKNKLEHYAHLLNVALPDLTDRAETLTGAIAAAKLMEKAG